MKRNLLVGLLIAAVTGSTVSAQSVNNNAAYVVTDSVRNSMKWNYIRTLDLRNGAYSPVLLRLLSNSELVLPSGTPNVLLNNGVAAIAYDKRNKRLYFTPMFTDKLRYVDLRTMQIVQVSNNFTGLMPKAADQSNVFTRMVIGDEGYGYALTNDGRHLIRFKTNGNPEIRDLGSLVDAPSNGEVSVHNACSSFGGDMIFDDEEKLILVTSRNIVFKINPETKVARLMGTISGLPAAFTTSGLAVNQPANKLVLVSNNDTTDVYEVNPLSLSARGLGNRAAWRGADLANNGVLKYKKERDEDNDPDKMITTGWMNAVNDSIQLYPNPVTNGTFRIQFSGVPAGMFTVNIIDAKGQLVQTKLVTTSGKISGADISLDGLVAKGIYIVRIIDNNNKLVFAEKIMVQ
jgi:Secretion system C-terminal sorting domain